MIYMAEGALGYLPSPPWKSTSLSLECLWLPKKPTSPSYGIQSTVLSKHTLVWLVPRCFADCSINDYEGSHDLHSVQMFFFFYSGESNDFITSFPNTPYDVADKIRLIGPCFDDEACFG